MAKNVYKHDKEQWKRWTTKQKNTFNNLYSQMLSSGYDILKHTDAPDMYDQYFKTIAWNAAFLAACEVTNKNK